MSFIFHPKRILDKHCFVYCGKERCNCKNGNPEQWKIQQEQDKKENERYKNFHDSNEFGGSDF